jgi:hypothetical protein
LALQLAFLLFLCVRPAPAQTLYSHGEPSAHEQYMLELVNSARANPAGAAARLGIDLNQGLPPGRINPASKPPLAFHPVLIAASRVHSDWMLATGIFSHTGAGGSTPTSRAAALGYLFPVAENIGQFGSSGLLDFSLATVINHEELFRSPSHRVNLMTAKFNVVGIGLRAGLFGGFNTLMATQNFSEGGATDDSGPFILGVAYDDRNRNGFYEPGEGLAGRTVHSVPGSYRAVTSASGGFAIPLPALEIRSENVAVPIPLLGTDSRAVETFDAEFRARKLSEAPFMAVQVTCLNLLPGRTRSKIVNVRRPVRINYVLRGTDNVFYTRTMVTSESVKVDFLASDPGALPDSDYTGDGKADILWRHNGNGAVHVWEMNGTSPVRGINLPAVGDLGWQIGGVGDLTGDGKPDILWRHNGNGAVHVWEMNGTSPVRGINLPTVGDLGWQIGGVGDLTGDGKADILWRHGGNGAVHVWEMNGTTAVRGIDLPAVGDLGWHIGGVGDLTGDGKADVLWRHGGNGAVHVWEMNGTSPVRGINLPAVGDLGWQIANN